MAHHHGSVELLGPEDTIGLSGRDGHRPRVVAALGALPADGPVLAEAVAAARRLDGELVLLHAVPLSFAERSVGLDDAVRAGSRLLADATARAAEQGRVPEEARLVRMWPHELVGERLDADVLVVGGRCAGSCRGPGAVTGTATGYAPCTVLVVPRTG
jgi:nucleotide-binding universal stress UspA family protein